MAVKRRQDHWICYWFKIKKGCMLLNLHHRLFVFLHNIKCFGKKKIGRQFNKSVAVVDQFYIKNCPLGATNLVKSSDKNTDAYSGYEIAFD